MSTVTAPGCVVILVEESAAMSARPAGQDQPLAATAATAINSLVRQLGEGPDFPIALVGYGEAGVGGRWGGAFAGRDFVPVAELAASPLRTESRTRKIPGRPEEAVAFPVWYDAPAGAGKSPQIAGFEQVQTLLNQWTASAPIGVGQPLVVHVFGGASSDGNPAKVVQAVQALGSGTLVFHAHLGVTTGVPPTLFPANRAYLPVGPIRDTFDRTSPLTPEMVQHLKSAQLVINAGARGLVYNGQLLDLVRCLGLVKAHVCDWAVAPVPVVVPVTPPAATPPPLPGSMEASADLPLALAPDLPAAIAADPARLIVLAIDRSLADPFSRDPHNAFGRLQERANELLTRLALKADPNLQVAVVAYGLDAVGLPEVRTGFEGALLGRPLVPATELRDGALRSEESTEEIPNGVGGLLQIKKTKLTYLEMDPAAACSPGPGFQEAAVLLDTWAFEHAAPAVPPIVVHLTRGQMPSAELEEAVQRLHGRAAVYHWVVTEEPHPTVAYPADAEALQTPELQAVWAATSPLVESFPADPTVKPGSKGMVVNGKFEAILAG